MFEQVSFIFPKFLWQNKINNISTERQNKTEKIVSDFLWNYTSRTKISFSKYYNKYIFFSSYQELFEGTQ